MGIGMRRQVPALPSAKSMIGIFKVRQNCAWAYIIARGQASVSKGAAPKPKCRPRRLEVDADQIQI